MSGPDGRAVVAAKFLDFGKPARILWIMVPAPDRRLGLAGCGTSPPPSRTTGKAAFDMRTLLNLSAGK